MGWIDRVIRLLLFPAYLFAILVGGLADFPKATVFVLALLLLTLAVILA